MFGLWHNLCDGYKPAALCPTTRHCQEEFPIYHNVCDHCGWPQHISLHSQEGHILIVQRRIKALDNADGDAQRELLEMIERQQF